MNYVFSILLFTLLFTQSTYAQYNYPATKQAPVTDTYFGKKVTDNYRWMENMNDSNVQEWFKHQASFADNILNNIEGRDALLQDMVDISNISAASVKDISVAGNRFFYRKIQAGEAVSKIYYRQGKNGTEILLVDPADFKKTKNCNVSFFSASHDGLKLAVGIEEEGVELSTVYIIDVNTKKRYDEAIYPCWFGINGWTDNNKGFIYTLQQTGNTEDNAMLLDGRAMYHEAGTDTAEDKEIFSRRKYPVLGIVAEDIPFIIMGKNNPYIVAIRAGVNNDLCSYIAPASALLQPVINWKPLTALSDSVQNIMLSGNKLYLLSHKHASNFQLLVTDAHKPDIGHATVVIKESKHKIESIVRTKDLLYIVYTDGINNTLKAYEPVTKKLKEVPLPESGTIRLYTYNNGSKDVLFNGYSNSSSDFSISITSWKLPAVLYDYTAATKRFEKSVFYTDAVYPGAADIVVEEIEVPGHDGIMIPLSIFYNKRVKRDGNAPCILGGYGSYGFIMHPFFAPYFLAGINKGLIAAWAHVRGGGEKGEAWYQAGYKQTKPNTWKDYISCAEYLISKKYTAAGRLTGWGTSAGGILIGRAVTERPDLFSAAIHEVSVSNVLRFEATPNGPNNAREFGTVKDSSEAMALINMDALHHIKTGTAYPAAMCIAGMNDPRVIPWQPGKFAAAMQQSSTSGKPVLLKINYDSGHFTENKMVTYKNFADAIAFALWQSGHPGFQVKNTAKYTTP